MDAVLALNAGSSSVKFGLYAKSDLSVLARGLIDEGETRVEFRVSGPLAAALSGMSVPQTSGHAEHIIWLTEKLKAAFQDVTIQAVGHRIVHGGLSFADPVLIDSTVHDQLETLIPFAPAHQPHNLAGVRAINERWPSLPQIACFDTAFHRTIPRLAQLFPIPRALSDSGLIRYGFHGLSYQHIAESLPNLPHGAPPKRVLAAHLGNGASLCALVNGRSIATTMGLTALDGLMMGTRSGAVDPGLVLHLIEEYGLAPAAVSRLLNKASGLLGVSGISGDVRLLEASDDPNAKEALDLFAYRAGREAGSLIAALQGLDAFVFSGGIGEHSSQMRSRICNHLRFMGLELDAARNTAHATKISAEDSRVAVFIIPANEELPIARAARAFAHPA